MTTPKPRKAPRHNKGWHWADDTLLDGGLTALEIAVYDVLSRHADARTQVAWPSTLRITHAIQGAAYDEVEHALESLRDKGHITITRQVTGSPARERSVYTLLDTRPERDGEEIPADPIVVWDLISDMAAVFMRPGDRAILRMSGARPEHLEGHILTVSVSYPNYALRLERLTHLMTREAQRRTGIPYQVRFTARETTSGHTDRYAYVDYVQLHRQWTRRKPNRPDSRQGF